MAVDVESSVPQSRDSGFQRELERLGVECRPGVPLSELTSLRVGGPAAWVCLARSEEQVAGILRACHRAGVPWVCLGAGSNVLAADEGFPGVVVLLRVRGIERRGAAVRVGAGTPLAELVRWMVDQGAERFAALGGIPGTVGGAVAGNAGAYGVEIGSQVLVARLMSPDGTVRAVHRDELGFRYRRSALQKGLGILVEVTLALEVGDPQRARERLAQVLAERAARHPGPEIATAGCFFKNITPPDGGRRVSAGLLLDRAGAGELRVGGAAIFPGHANMIVNRGAATAAEIARLAAAMRRRVRERFGIELEPEVRLLGLTLPEA